MITGYHFVGETLRDGRPVPADDQWLIQEGGIALCEEPFGLHGSQHPMDALKYAEGATLCLCEYDGEVIHGDDKLVAEKRRIIKRIDATDLLWGFSRWAALQVIHLWKAPDVVKQFLKTGNGDLRAAAEREVSNFVDSPSDEAMINETPEWSAVVAAEWVFEKHARRAAELASEWAASADRSQVASQRDQFKKLVDSAFERCPANRGPNNACTIR